MTVQLDFVDVSGQAARAVEAVLGTQYWLNDRAIARPFGSVMHGHDGDLLCVAMSVYAADRLVPRGSAWTRDFRVSIPVLDVDHSRTVSTEIEFVLETITGDRWHLEFRAGRYPWMVESQETLFPETLGSSDTVALFSGGLDSFAGASKWLSANPGRLVLVGARSSSVIGRDQLLLARLLRANHGNRVIEVGVPLGLRTAMAQDNTQRSRTFLYLALAAVVARLAHVPLIQVFENGYGAFNPRLDIHQMGTHANRGVHPYVLWLLQRVFGRLGFPVEILLPHAYQTKAEVVAGMLEDDRVGIGLSASCESYPLRTAQYTHCGRCPSCILRRQSVAVNHFETYDRRDYQFQPFDHPVMTNEDLIRSGRQAWQFQSIESKSWIEIATEWPSLSLDPDGIVDRSRLTGMLHRYSEEWMEILRYRKRLKAAMGWPEREAA